MSPFRHPPTRTSASSQGTQLRAVPKSTSHPASLVATANPDGLIDQRRKLFWDTKGGKRCACLHFVSLLQCLEQLDPFCGLCGEGRVLAHEVLGAADRPTDLLEAR